jgi:hypothetical protein
MKAVFTISTLISLAMTGIASLYFFQRAHYDISALLTITSFISVTLWVSILTNKKSIIG